MFIVELEAGIQRNLGSGFDEDREMGFDPALATRALWLCGGWTLRFGDQSWFQRGARRW